MYNTIEEVRRERHRLERRASRQEKNIRSQYRRLKNKPFGDSKVFSFLKIASNFGHLIGFLKRFRRK